MFYLWWIEPVLKDCKVPKYYDSDTLKNFLHFQWWFKFLEKEPHAPKSYFYQKTANKQNGKLSKVKFWPKPDMQNGAYTKSLNLERQRNWLALYCY